MSSDPQEKILDAYLEEMLGDLTPPDVSDRVVRALQSDARSSATNKNGNGRTTRQRSVQDLLPPAALSAQPPVANDQVATPSPRPIVSDRSRKKTPQALPTAALVLALVAVVCGVGYAVFQLASRDTSDQIAVDEDTPKNSVDNQPAVPQPKRPSVQPQVADTSTSPTRQPNDTPRNPTGNPAVPQSNQPDASAEQIVQRPKLPDALSDDEIVALVDTSLKSVWDAAEVTPAGSAADDVFCRRTYLKLIGRAPTDEEVQSFAAGEAKSKREILVDQLAASDEFPRHWSRLLAETLVSANNVGSANTQQLQKYLDDSLRRGIAYDEIVLELLTATGTNDPSSENYNPATSYLLAHTRESTTHATAEMSRHFLGQRVACVQCHDSYVADNDWKQQRFWQLDSFLRQLEVKHGGTNGASALAVKDFKGEGSTPSEAEVYFTQANGLMSVSYPVFIDGQAIDKSGYVADVDRRKMLAQFVVASKEFRVAAANRIWSELLGSGFVTPVDDLGPHNPPVHPQLLNHLADQFAAHDFDLRSLAGWIAKSQAFRLDVVPVIDTPASNLVDRTLFASYHEPQPVVTDLVKSLTLFAKARAGAKFSDQDQQQIGRLVGPLDPKLSAPLQIIDGDMGFLDGFGSLGTTIADETFDSVTRRVVYGSLSPRQKVEHLFQYRLGRLPNKHELQQAANVIGEEESDSGYRVLSWTLRNTTE